MWLDSSVDEIVIHNYQKSCATDGTSVAAIDQETDVTFEANNVDSNMNSLNTTPTNALYNVRAWFHAKHAHKVKSSFVQQRLVHFQLKPDWGSIELTKVMMLMLQEVSSDGGTLYFS